MSIQRPALIAAPVLLALAVATATIRATPQAPSTDITASLLAEVHELRVAMERSASVAPRVQLTLARLNIQEQRTVSLSAQLDQVRQEQTRSSLETRKLAGELEGVEKARQTTLDDRQRRGYEFEEQELKRRIAEQAAVEERLRSREAEAAQLLAAEQSRWVDLNAKLDELERLLGPIR